MTRGLSFRPLGTVYPKVAGLGSGSPVGPVDIDLNYEHY